MSLKYTGITVSNGSMNVYDAAANMIAFSEFAVEAAKIVYGDKARADANVTGFGKGSFITDMVIHVGGVASSLFTSASIKHVLTIMNQSILLWKHLKGEQPKSIKKNGNEANVTNQYGDIYQVKTKTLNLVFSDKSSQAVDKFIREALDKEGIEKVSVCSDEFEGELIDVNQDESQWFKDVTPESPLDDFNVTQSLMIEAPVFKNGNKWRFSDASSSFYASIKDEVFLSEVNQGKRFAKGDMLRVEMRIYQSQKGDKLVGEKEIIQVLEHKERAYQHAIISD